LPWRSDGGVLTETLTDRVLRLLGVTGNESRDHRMESRKLFLYWALRNAGESDLQSVLEVSRLDAPPKGPSREEFLVLNGLYSGSGEDRLMSPGMANSYRLSETMVQAQTGIREQMNLIESVNRKALKVEAGSLQNRLIVLTFVLFIVPFSFLLCTSFMFPDGSPITAAFLCLHPLISYLVAKWASMHDDLLAI